MTLGVIPLSEFSCIFRNDLALSQPLRRQKEQSQELLVCIGDQFGCPNHGRVSYAVEAKHPQVLKH